MTLMPKQIGYQDLVALMARQSETSQRARAHMLASPFGTIHAATFSFPQPVGSHIPEPPRYQLAAATPDVTGPIVRGFAGADLPLHRPRLDFPSVNRRLKGDLLVSRPRDEPPGGTRDLTPGRVKTVSFPKPGDVPATDQPPTALVPPAAEPASEAMPPAAEMESATEQMIAALPPAAEPVPLEQPAAAEAEDPEADVVTAALTPKAEIAILVPPLTYSLASLPLQGGAPAGNDAPDPIDDANPAVRLGRLYFGNNPVGEAIGTIQPWPAEEELQIVAPAADPDFKRTALAPSMPDEAGREGAALSSAVPSSGQTIAPKGEVTGAGKRPKTPAERLGLNAKERAKAEKCLTEAIYFESRGEVKRGQIAVAQVVMNRVFSGFYPDNVCGVVYQNAHRKFACQFTFACDNVKDVVNEPDMWEQAKEISRDMLDGKLWLPEIGHSTHYHAYWVHPSWVNEMRKLHKIGVHSFYRPRAWGDGSDVPPLNQSQTPAAAEAEERAKL
jgi:spore germination cell wall hydrolase CwlJ-like protein